MLCNALAQLLQRDAVIKADADARRIGCQAQHVVTQVFVHRAPVAAVHGVEQGFYLVGAGIGVVLEDVAKNGLVGCLPLGPEHGGGIAHLHALGRVFAQQVVQRGGVGKGSSAADRGVFALALGFAIGLEGAGVEGNDVGTRGLCAPHAFDGCVQPLHRGLFARDEAHGLRCIVIGGGVERGVHHSGPLAHQVHVTLQTKAHYRVALQRV